MMGVITMKKAVLCLAVAVVALIVMVGFVYYGNSLLNSQVAELQTQNSAFQNQTTYLQEQNALLKERIDQLLEQHINFSSSVKITGYEWIGGFNPVAGLTLYCPLNVTVHNTGGAVASGLSLDAQLINKYDGSPIGSGGSTVIAPLQPGESRVITGHVYVGLDSSLEDAACIITVKSGGTVVDQWIRVFN